MHQALEDYVHTFQSQDRIPIFLNEIDINSVEGMKSFNEKIMTLYEEESLTSAPSCVCKALRGGRNFGDTCPKCNTKVEYDLEREIENEIWVRAPEGLPGLINPTVFVMLEEFLTKGNNNLLMYLIDSSYKYDPYHNWFIDIETYGFTRGLKFFIDNFDEVMEAAYKVVRSDRRKEIPAMRELLERNRDVLFPPYLVLPNRMAFVIENNEYSRWANETVKSGVNAIRTIVGADQSNTGRPHSLARKETLVAKGLQAYGQFWIEFISNVAGRKPGYFRQEIFGQRSHFTFRGVIISDAKRHVYNHIRIPWKMGVQLFKDHLISLLIKGDKHFKRMSIKAADELLVYANNNYVELINYLFDKLLYANPSGQGYPCSLQRNPSLKRGSNQGLFIPPNGGIKTDLNDYTISLSPLILIQFNADFDGKLIAVVKFP